MRLLLVLAVLFATSGCAHDRHYFHPTERVRGQTADGYLEAFYDLVGPRGAFGEAKVWSVGVYRRGDDSVVGVTLELHNTSGQPIDVSAKDLQLDPVRGSRGTLRRVPPQETGVFRVVPGTHASVRVHFVLPPGMPPGHVESFGFIWRVKNLDQVYAQATPFREEAYSYYSPGYPMYYSPVYPCSPYDVHCVGFYYGYGYGYPYAGPPVVVEHGPGPARRVVVH